MRSSSLLPLLPLAAALGPACASPEGQVLMAELQGQVVDAGSGLPIPGAEITVRLTTGTPLGTTHTDDEGAFRLSILETYSDAWLIQGEIERYGYVPTTFHQTVQMLDWQLAAVDGRPGHRVEPALAALPPFRVARQTHAEGELSGRVFDALIADQAAGLSGLTVQIREGINAPTTSPVLAETLTLRDEHLSDGTDDNYHFGPLPAGSYTVQVEGGSEYIDGTLNTVVIGGSQLQGQDIGLTEALEPNQFRVVLTWGDDPSDLDSHLVGPMPADSEALEFHVYYAESTDPDGGAVCYLDVDDTTQYGPETVTVRSIQPGEYTYAVHDYTNRDQESSTALSLSGARVQLFYDIDQTRIFEVPPNQVGTVWSVFTLDAAEGAVVPLNRFSSVSAPAQVL